MPRFFKRENRGEVHKRKEKKGKDRELEEEKGWMETKALDVGTKRSHKFQEDK